MTSTTDKSDKEVAEVLLKTDRLGRITVPPETRELLLDRFEASGLSGQVFAAQIGVKYPTFATWVQKRRRARGEYANEACTPIKAPLTLVEAIVEEPERERAFEAAAASLELETVSGLKLCLKARADIPVAVELLKALKDAEL